MRQQRCGFNPWLKDSCHTHDGYVIYGGKDDSLHIDVTGGWHDAADYLQYVATSANATYQMLFAFSENPSSFGDNFLANGLPGKDSIPDVLNESRWGLDWLLKMNPAPGIMYNQIADDRDHIGFRFPECRIQLITGKDLNDLFIAVPGRNRDCSNIKTVQQG